MRRTSNRGDGEVIDLHDRAGARRIVRSGANKYWEHFWLAPAPYLVTDGRGLIREANRASGEFFGAEYEDVLGRPLAEFVAPESRREFDERLAGFAPSQRTIDWEVRLELTSGARWVVASVAASAVRTPAGVVSDLRWILNDITERKLVESRIAYMAYHDGLTGLPNRTKFLELLGLALAKARQAGRSVAVLSLDLDGFKAINDNYGHAAGDDVLRQIGTRLRTASRGTDVVGRIGGDEFAVLLADLDLIGGRATDGRHPERIAARIRQSLHQPCVLVGAEVRISASIGIGVFPREAHSEHDLLAVADSAMYAAKGEHRSLLRPRSAGD
jgi:diguanylate cyclase (GGDEF)-like protein/PAS domain S-box-containing protein